MPLPVIADTYQLRLNWNCSSAPRDASNTLHYFDASGSQTAANLQADFAASVSTNMWHVVTASANVNRIDITPLDGTSASLSTNIGPGAPWAGFGGTDLILQGAAVVSLKSTQRGKSARGRIYLPWVGEVNQNNGVLAPSNVTAMQGAWTAHQAAMIAAGWTPVVVSPTLNTSYALASYVVRPNLLTQRRRARR